MKLLAIDKLQLPAFASTPDGRLVFVNAAWRERFAAGVGDPWHDPFPKVEIDTIGEAWQACHLAHQPFMLEASSPSERYRILCQPVLENGQVLVLGTMADITQQSRQEAETEAILDTAVDAIIIIDETGRIETFNKAATQLFGYTAAETLGKPVSMLMPEPHRSQHDHYMSRYLTTGEAKIIGIGRDLEAVDQSGRRIPIHLSVSEVQSESGRRFTGIIRDLSEQQAARQALAEQREKLAHVGRLSSMGEMTASIAHEINQPLTAISMYAQAGIKLIDRGEPDLARLRDALEKLNTQSLRAGAVIERIQRFARAQKSERIMLDVNHLLDDLGKLAESDARLYNVELELELAPGLPEVFGDPIQVQQVALNLIRNAIDAMRDIRFVHGRRISLSTSLRSDRMVEIAVSDLGPGVAEDQKELLFTPFHTTKKEGMGMGLSICRSIMTEHGGALSYRDNDGPGATFFFTLPTWRADDE
ncbi:MAG TPA: PAS domain S-box protein [Pseudomonadales bacterium]